jgi:hypothetical protein
MGPLENTPVALSLIKLPKALSLVRVLTVGVLTVPQLLPALGVPATKPDGC